MHLYGQDDDFIELLGLSDFDLYTKLSFLVHHSSNEKNLIDAVKILAKKRKWYEDFEGLGSVIMIQKASQDSQKSKEKERKGSVVKLKKV